MTSSTPVATLAPADGPKATAPGSGLAGSALEPKQPIWGRPKLQPEGFAEEAEQAARKRIV